MTKINVRLNSVSMLKLRFEYLTISREEKIFGIYDYNYVIIIIIITDIILIT